MLVQVNTPQVEVLQGVMDATKDAINSFYKGSKNILNYQVVDAKKFATDYFDGSVGMCIPRLGEMATRVEQKTEAEILDVFEQYTAVREGDNMPRYFHADSRHSVMVYNGRYYEHQTAEELEIIIKYALRNAEVGKVYEKNSPKKIADEVLKELWNGNYRWTPSGQYFVFANGVLNTDTMQLLPHSEKYLTNNIFDVDFDPNAKCEEFQKCLDFSLGKDEQLTLQELCGYMLFPDCRHEKIGVLVGNGRNGKSLLLRAISYALGDERCSHYNLSEMTDSKGLSIASSMGKIANISYDSGNVIKVGSEAIFKQYCSGEPLKAKILYKQHTETTSYPKSLIAVNELPQSADFSDGFYRRFLIVEFPKQIPIEQVDVNLFDQLKKEQVGILLWIIEGYKRLKSNGRFTESESTKQAMEDYRTNSDNVKIFLREMGWRKSDKKVKLSNLYSIYKEWAEKNGYRNPVASTKFGVRLRLLQFEVKASTGNITYVWAEQEERPIEVDDNAPF